MSSPPEGSSTPRGPEQDTATEENSTIRHIDHQNFSRPLLGPHSIIASSATPVAPTSNTEESNDPALAEFLAAVSWQSSSVNKSKSDTTNHGESSSKTKTHDMAENMTSTDTIPKQALPGSRTLTRLERAAGMRERPFTDEEVKAENMARNAKANAELLAELEKTGYQIPRPDQIQWDQSGASIPDPEPQTKGKGKQRESQNVMSNESQHQVYSEPQADSEGKQAEKRNVVSNATQPSIPSEPEDKQATKLKRQKLLAQTSRPVKESSTTMQCPECQLDLQVTLRALPSVRSVISDPATRPLPWSHRRPNTYKPSSSTQAGKASLPAVKETEPERHTYPPRPADFTGCQSCWELVHNPFEGVDPPADGSSPTPTPPATKCCGITCGCLDTLLEAAVKIFGACVNSLKKFGCCGLCLKVVERVPLVKERRKKREVRKGKRADQSGHRGENDDRQGIQRMGLGNKGKRKASAGVGGFWISDQQTGESNGSPGARDDGTDEGASTGERRETEYDRKRVEDAQKSPWQRIGGTVTLNRRR